MLMIVSTIIFVICIIFFIWDRFRPATIAIAGCTAMVICKVLTPGQAFAGLTNDIVLIVFGTEIFGIAFLESGLAHIVTDFIVKVSGGNEKKIILIAGSVAAGLSAFLNNQVVCTLMMVICITIAKTINSVNVKNITLPVIICAIFGGQMTLIGAPATLVASSVADENTGLSIGMFDLLPMGILIFAAGMLFILMINHGRSKKIWDKTDKVLTDSSGLYEYRHPDKKKITITLISGTLMVICFIGGWITVGIASLVGALIVLFGGVVKQREALAKIDWNILIWLGCSIGLTEGFVKGGGAEMIGAIFIGQVKDFAPIIVLIVFVVITFIVSNFIANTTTVMMVLPFALSYAGTTGVNEKTFLIAITMAAGLSVMTPLSCGFIGMTMRVGYCFKDYIRYSALLQCLLAVLTIVLTCAFFPL